MFYIYYISGNIFKKIDYINSNNLIKKLNKILKEYSNSHQYIQLLFKENIINIGNKKNNLKIELLEKDFIQVIIIDKYEIFYSEEYILDIYYLLIIFIILINIIKISIIFQIFINNIYIYS